MPWLEQWRVQTARQDFITRLQEARAVLRAALLGASQDRELKSARPVPKAKCHLKTPLHPVRAAHKVPTRSNPAASHAMTVRRVKGRLLSEQNPWKLAKSVLLGRRLAVAQFAPFVRWEDSPPMPLRTRAWATKCALKVPLSAMSALPDTLPLRQPLSSAKRVPLGRQVRPGLQAVLLALRERSQQLLHLLGEPQPLFSAQRPD